MNDKGDKTCPLCADEMDLTDQHFKPCKCGYQICVWCWHRIIDMAEKDKTAGRCPACRTPYDKQKKEASCESLVAELNNDRKKSQKVKAKSSEGRKDLTGVRVIQRNLVYVMSLPLDLADEDLFQSKEYFGQYGKVVKVALARTQSGEIQQFPNNSCSVYITYSKEEEAIRCIRSVHLFVFDGRPLKACFGTMKYCHAWIRNMPCNNVECLYLHEIGFQEDSFTKDEAISVHMRKIIEDITVAVPNSPRRSGSMLPPPVGDNVDNVSIPRQIPKCVLNNAQSVVKTSPPNSSNGRSVSLPAGALWGMHASSKSSVPNIPCSGEILRVKAETVSSAVGTNSVQVSASHPALEDNHTSNGNGLKSQELLNSKTEFPELSLVNRTQASNGKALVSASHSDVLKKPAIEVSHISYGNTLKPQDLLDSQTDFPELPSVNRTQTNNKPLVPAIVDNTRAISVPSDCTDFPEPTSQSCRSMLSSGDENINGGIQSVCSDAVSVDSDSVLDGYGGLTGSDSSHVDHVSLKSSHTEVSRDSLQQCVNETGEAQLVQRTGITKANDVVVSREDVNVGTALISPLVTNRHLQAEDDISSFIRERLKDPEVFSCQPIASSKGSFLRTMQPSSSQYMAEHNETRSLFGSSADSRGSNIASISHGFNEMPQSEPGRHSMLFPDIANGNCGVDSQGSSRNEIDDRIASIMSLDLDEYLTSPHSLSKQLGTDDVEARSRKLASYCEVKNNQSRFSFARQDESNDQAFRSSNLFNQRPHGSDFYQNSSERQSRDMNMLGMYNGVSSSYLKGMDYVTPNATLPSSYKPPSIARSPVTAPPGFSVTSRPPPPPPGFSSNGREQQILNGFSGNHRYSEPPVYNTTPYHQSLPIENNGGVRDVEFLDPAILAVGQGIENPSLDYRSNFQGNTNMFSSELKLQQQQHQLAMQSPLSSHQNCRLTDSLGMASRFIDQSRNVALPNGCWDGLSNEIQSQNRFQNERFIGSTNRMSGYNGTFRI
ncbi:hypothetical protein HA466_0234230 [Hirschfeldia incana]|nr:hypothetical protein HA466_0234230 [Hirschfeldia incana]